MAGEAQMSSAISFCISFNLPFDVGQLCVCASATVALEERDSQSAGDEHKLLNKILSIKSNVISYFLL